MNPNYIFLSLALVEMVLLFFLSRALIKALSQIFYFLTRSREKTVYLLALIFFPGTFIHEMAHVIVAGSMLVETGHISLFPEIMEGGVKLGSAEIVKTDMFRRAIIGVAPVLIGITILLGSLFFFIGLAIRGDLQIWHGVALFYILFVISNTMFSSKKDMEGAAGAFFIVIAFFIAIYVLNFRQPFDWFENQLNSWLGNFLKQVDIFFTIPLIADFLIYLLAKLAIKRH